MAASDDSRLSRLASRTVAADSEGSGWAGRRADQPVMAWQPRGTWTGTFATVVMVPECLVGLAVPAAFAKTVLLHPVAGSLGLVRERLAGVGCHWGAC